MFIYLQVICFDSRVVKQHCGSSVGRTHAESLDHSKNKVFRCLKFFFTQGFRTIQQESQIHGAVTYALRHQSSEGQGREGGIGRCWCGSGEHGEGGTNFTAQGVVVTVTKEEKNKVNKICKESHWQGLSTDPKYPVCDRVSPYLAVVRVIVVQDDFVAVGDSLTLMDAHLTLRRIHTTHGHLIQQLA